MRFFLAVTFMSVLSLGSACGRDEAGGAAKDVPAVAGSVAEFVHRGGLPSEGVMRLAVLAAGQIAMYRAGPLGDEAFVRNVGSFDASMIGSIRAISANASLAQIDDPDQLTVLNSGEDVACPVGLPQQELILRRANDASTLAQRTYCVTSMNPSLTVVDSPYAWENEHGMKVAQIAKTLSGMVMLLKSGPQ